MSTVRYWPYPVTALIVLLALALIALVVAVLRLRSGVLPYWPHAVAATVGLALLAGATAFATRPPFLSAPAPAMADESSGATVADFEAYANRLVAASEPPGLSVVVVKDGEIVYTHSFGAADGPREIPATEETVYRWWSITKVFTATAIMQLQEQGLLSIDDPVIEHLPMFDVAYPTATSEPVTIRHLLTHTSGLPDAGMEILGWLHFEGDAPLDQSALLARTLPDHRTLLAEPGTEGRYTNIGYMVLSAVIEAVTGQRYEDYIIQRVLQSLGMEHTGFGYPADTGLTEAVGSHPVDVMAVGASFAVDMERAVRERHQGRLWFNRVYPDQTGPSGLLGTPKDMALFMMAMLDHGEGDGSQILSPESVVAMGQGHADATHSPAPIPGFEFGLGWFRFKQDGRVSLSHGGQGMGNASLMRIYPEEGLGIVVVANSTYLGRNFGHDAVEVLSRIPWEDLGGVSD